MNESIWNKTVKLQKFPTPDKDIQTDVLIIGGGICGILCGYMLKRKGIDCVIAEGENIASGITGNTTAKIAIGHGLIYNKIIENYGKEKAMMYLNANQRAMAEYQTLCQNTDCDYERKNSYIYTTSDRQKIEKEITALNTLGVNAHFESNMEIPVSSKGALCLKDQTQFNPLKFIAEISSELTIYENTFIRGIKEKCAYAESHLIRANKIIVATHFPFINKHGMYFLKLYQHRSYVSAFEGIEPLNGMYIDESLKGLSFRSYSGLTLIGGGGHRTGKSGKAWTSAEDFAKKHYPDAKLLYRWAAQDTMSLDGIPYIGKYSPNTPDLYVATGFNKWGFTSAMVAATILCDEITGKENMNASVFCPQRSMLKPQLALNGFEATINLITPTTRRCPHLGCALKWNKAEHTWDCPCHGSRFNENGGLIDNPAKRDM